MRTLSRVLRVSATALMLVPLIASSQEHLSEGWAEVKQEMIKLGMRYDSAWELYQAFETEASGARLSWNVKKWPTSRVRCNTSSNLASWASEKRSTKNLY